MDSPEENAYLYQLYTQTQGDMDAQVSMYTLGESLGLDKTQSGSLAESLFIQGLAELKTLSGGIAITRAGLSALDVVPETPKLPGLGNARELDESLRHACETLSGEIKSALSQLPGNYENLEIQVIHLKTLEVQLLSPTPAVPVIREIFRALGQNLDAPATQEISQKIHQFIAP
ncbi:MAG: hypothetical protein MI747_14415 [Desulfobacterales bacterium]|nr:hypothetical protein [Desulfobacterales bacterium]